VLLALKGSWAFITTYVSTREWPSYSQCGTESEEASEAGRALEQALQYVSDWFLARQTLVLFSLVDRNLQGLKLAISLQSIFENVLYLIGEFTSVHSVTTWLEDLFSLADCQCSAINKHEDLVVSGEVTVADIGEPALGLVCMLLPVEVVNQAVLSVSGSIAGIIAEDKCNPWNANSSHQNVSVNWGALKSKSFGLLRSARIRPLNVIFLYRVVVFSTFLHVPRLSMDQLLNSTKNPKHIVLIAARLPLGTR
jgi:hypothetical protein